MTPRSIGFATIFFACVAFSWVYFFRRDIRRWWIERGPRRQIAAEAAAERQAELERLREELAAKYLEPGAAKPPRPGA
jgi:hypothetical protein